MIRWFKTKRALIARTYDLEGIIAKQVEELEILHAEFAEGWNRAVAEQNRLMRQRDDIRRNLGGQIRAQAATIAAQQSQLAQICEELTGLRDDLRREEIRQAEGNLPSATGPGMARVANQPMSWQDADAIAQDAAAKRQEDV